MVFTVGWAGAYAVVTTVGEVVPVLLEVLAIHTPVHTHTMMQMNTGMAMHRTKQAMPTPTAILMAVEKVLAIAGHIDKFEGTKRGKEYKPLSTF